MAAANTDKLRKKKNLFSTNLNGSITDSATTLTCDSLTGVPTDTAVTITIDRVDANGTSTPSLREDVTGVVSGNNLTNLLRGEGDTTAQVHSDNAVVEITWDAETWNDAVDWGLVEHKQDGTHGDTTVDSITVANNIDVVDGKSIRDANDNELVTFSQTASAVNEITIKNAATGNPPEAQATGGDTNIDIKLLPKGTGVITVTGTTNHSGS